MPGTSNSGGRNRKSRREHELAGTYRKHRHAKLSTSSDPPKGRPTPPKPLKGEALAEWKRMVDRLDVARTLSAVDDAVLYRYCQLHARADRLERQIATLKSICCIDHLGNERVHPAVAQLRLHDVALRGFLVEFGLTPAARSRVTPTSATLDDTDPFAEFDEPFKPKVQ